jgi:hypothetical protein
MLIRNTQVASPEKFISDNLTHKPSVQQSAFDNLAFGVATPQYAINSYDAEYMQSPRGQTAAATYEALKRGNENPEVGWIQWGVNEASNMIGQSLNPLSFALAEAGGFVARPLISVGEKFAPSIFKKPIAEIFNEKMGKYFPKTIGTEEAEKTLSLGLLGEQWAKGFGIGAGAMLPQATIDSFNAETGKHDIAGMAAGMGAGGVFGMMIGTVPFAWGIFKANFNRIRGRAPTAEIEVGAPEKALEDGLINKETYDFWKELEEYRKTPEGRAELSAKLKPKATEYVASQGHVVDHVNDRVQFEILNRDQINNLQSATIDQLVADHIPEEHRTALSDFTVQAGIDEMRNKTNLLDGVRGYVEHIDNSLKNREAILKTADGLFEHHLKMSHGELPFDQKSIYNTISEHGENVPFTIPQEVRKAIKTGEVENLKSPIEELTDIKEKLLPLKKRFTASPYFKRLEDLAEVWHPAKTLLDRIHLEDELNRQEAYHDLAKQMLAIADSNVAKLADQEKARNYLETRITPVIDSNHSPKSDLLERASKRDIPPDADALLAEHDAKLQEMSVENSGKEYEVAREKFKEFQSQEGIFKSFINCVIGSQK